MKSAGSQSDFMKHVQAAMVVIRQQRQRACLERICRALRRQQLLKNVDQKIVETELEAAVQQGELYAVDKHGYRSYQVENVPYNMYTSYMCVFCSFSVNKLAIKDIPHIVWCQCCGIPMQNSSERPIRISGIDDIGKIEDIGCIIVHAQAIRCINLYLLCLSSSCLSRLSMNRRRPLKHSHCTDKLSCLPRCHLTFRAVWGFCRVNHMGVSIGISTFLQYQCIGIS